MKIPEVTFKTRIGDNEALGGACSIGGEWKNVSTSDMGDLVLKGLKNEKI